MSSADPVPPFTAVPSARHWRISLAAALTATLAVAAIGFWLNARAPHPLVTGGAPFDLDTAMALAGGEVPSQIEDFYFFPLDRNVAGESVELSEKLTLAAAQREYLGVAGADPEHNLTVVLDALATNGRRDLSGLILIYIGPVEQKDKLASAVSVTGAELRFVPYAPATSVSAEPDKQI